MWVPWGYRSNNNCVLVQDVSIYTGRSYGVLSRKSNAPALCVEEGNDSILIDDHLGLL